MRISRRARTLLTEGRVEIKRVAVSAGRTPALLALVDCDVEGKVRVRWRHDGLVCDCGDVGCPHAEAVTVVGPRWLRRVTERDRGGGMDSEGGVVRDRWGGRFLVGRVQRPTGPGEKYGE